MPAFCGLKLGPTYNACINMPNLPTTWYLYEWKRITRRMCVVYGQVRELNEFVEQKKLNKTTLYNQSYFEAINVCFRIMYFYLCAKLCNVFYVISHHYNHYCWKECEHQHEIFSVMNTHSLLLLYNKAGAQKNE